MAVENVYRAILYEIYCTGIYFSEKFIDICTFLRYNSHIKII